jgi:hypothetical protein
VIDSVGRFVYRVRRQNECMLALMSVLALIRHALLTIHQEKERQNQKRSLSSSLRQTLLKRRRVRRMRPCISPKDPFIPCSETLSLPSKGWGRNIKVSGDQVGECHENLSQVDERSGKPRMKCVQPSKRINCPAPQTASPRMKARGRTNADGPSVMADQISDLTHCHAPEGSSILMAILRSKSNLYQPDNPRS